MILQLISLLKLSYVSQLKMTVVSVIFSRLLKDDSKGFFWSTKVYIARAYEFFLHEIDTVDPL